MPLLARLEALHLLKVTDPEDAAPGGEADAGALLRLCHAGYLVGGLSVALDVRPDELMGSLLHQMGGSAPKLKVLDVREKPALTLTIFHQGGEERWELEDLATLVHNLNDLFRADPAVKRVAVLGEWDDALQLWCIPRQALAALRQDGAFRPWNDAALL